MSRILLITELEICIWLYGEFGGLDLDLDSYHKGNRMGTSEVGILPSYSYDMFEVPDLRSRKPHLMALTLKIISTLNLCYINPNPFKGTP